MGLSKKRVFRFIFWTGYLFMVLAAFIPLKKDLHKITFKIAEFRFHFDQILHSLVYFLICLYFAAGQRINLKLFDKNPLIKFFIAVIFLAGFTEVVQIAVPSRTFNLFDIVANLIGISLGTILIKFRNLRSVQ